MKYRPLGKTGLEVSEISLGTVELGMDYGFRGSRHAQKPDPEQAIRLIYRALDWGINLIDTARSYGTSEELIGKALHGMLHRPYIASKVVIPSQEEGSRQQACLSISASIEASLEALKIETIDLLQIHNTTLEMLHQEETWNCLQEAKRQGKIRFLGASAYGEAISLEILHTAEFQTLQVPFNLLDQKLAQRVWPAAAERGVGLLARSAFLRGALTPRINEVPASLDPLKEAALKAREVLGDEVQSLSEAALRFCLSFPEISTVIIGVRSLEELQRNLTDACKGSLAPEQLQKLSALSIEDEYLVNPTHWKEVI